MVYNQRIEVTEHKATKTVTVILSDGNYPPGNPETGLGYEDVERICIFKKDLNRLIQKLEQYNNE
jgi:hypothetical protein